MNKANLKVIKAVMDAVELHKDTVAEMHTEAEERLGEMRDSNPKYEELEQEVVHLDTLFNAMEELFDACGNFQ